MQNGATTVESSMEISQKIKNQFRQDGGEIGESRVHFPSTPVKHLADLRSRATANGIPAYMKIGDQR